MKALVYRAPEEFAIEDVPVPTVDHETRDATAADATELAKLLYLAGRSQVETSIYDLMIPGPPGMTDDRIAQMARIIAADKPSWLSYRYYHVIEVDGKVASGLATFTIEQAGNKQLGKAMMSQGWGVMAMLSMSRRMKIWSKVDPGREPGYLIVENVATFEDYRGNGFAAELLDLAAALGRDSGYKGLQLTVLIGNDPAIMAYEKAGFKVSKTRENKKFEQAFLCPGAAQMLLKF